MIMIDDLWDCTLDEVDSFDGPDYIYEKFLEAVEKGFGATIGFHDATGWFVIATKGPAEFVYCAEDDSEVENSD